MGERERHLFSFLLFIGYSGRGGGGWWLVATTLFGRRPTGICFFLRFSLLRKEEKWWWTDFFWGGGLCALWPLIKSEDLTGPLARANQSQNGDLSRVASIGFGTAKFFVFGGNFLSCISRRSRKMCVCLGGFLWRFSVGFFMVRVELCAPCAPLCSDC